MNRQRRNALHKVLDDLNHLRDPVDKEEAINIIKKSQIQVEKCCDEEEAALDNRPESFQWSSANDDMTDNISDLSDASSDLEIVLEDCQEMEFFNYDLIKSDIIKIVNAIKKAIHR